MLKVLVLVLVLAMLMRRGGDGAEGDCSIPFPATPAAPQKSFPNPPPFNVNANVNVNVNILSHRCRLVCLRGFAPLPLPLLLPLPLPLPLICPVLATHCPIAVCLSVSHRVAHHFSTSQPHNTIARSKGSRASALHGSLLARLRLSRMVLAGRSWLLSGS